MNAPTPVTAIADPFRFQECPACRRGQHDRCRGRQCECTCGGGALLMPQHLHTLPQEPDPPGTYPAAMCSCGAVWLFTDRAGFCAEGHQHTRRRCAPLTTGQETQL